MKTKMFIILILLTSTLSYAQLSSAYKSTLQPSLIKSDNDNFKSPYNLEWNREFYILLTGTTMNIAGIIIGNNVDPLTEEEINALDVNDINEFDRKAITPFSESANGDLLLYSSFLLPLTFFIDERTRNDWQMLGLMWIEVMAIQSGLNILAKTIATRTRPYVYDPDTPMEKKQTVNARFSFYSGHTSTTAATTFYLARVFSNYLENNLVKTLIWTGAVVYPALVAYARRNTGNHFRTDVITGYLIGAAVGYFIPELHLNNESVDVSLYKNLKNDGVTLNLTCKF